ncbi:hypothetical protein [Burkholderia sp. LMG 32019]|uniref:hypothetical protein n=1 Tax=Burkholderia sp. LMG 32019 TaxID=3158173 RepID=UPI003C302AE2
MRTLTIQLFAASVLTVSLAQPATAELPSGAQTNQPVIMLGRDTPILIDGVKQTVSGPDLCPDNLGGCTILTGRSGVNVGLSSGAIEQWTVKWSADGQRFSLVRPNGQLVKLVTLAS